MCRIADDMEGLGVEVDILVVFMDFPSFQLEGRDEFFKWVFVFGLLKNVWVDGVLVNKVQPVKNVEAKIVSGSFFWVNAQKCADGNFVVRTGE